MRHSVHGSLAVLFIVSAAVQAESLRVQRQPTVVYEGPSTILAQPYYQRLKRKDTTGSSVVVVPDGAGVLPLDERLPLSPSRLELGRPDMKTVAGLITPLFVMGMDEVSLTWFRRAAQGLVDIGARGLVVEAHQLADWRELQQRARSIGIDLMLMDGDSLARGYGLRTYPVVLMRPALAQRGSHE